MEKYSDSFNWVKDHHDCQSTLTYCIRLFERMVKSEITWQKYKEILYFSSFLFQN